MRRLLIVCSVVIIVFASAAAQAAVGDSWDLATDWTTTTASGVANFGNWGIDGAVPGWWFNIPTYYNERFPYNDQAYDVDAWVLQKGSFSGMIGKLLPGGSSGAYDWPAGSIAFQTPNWIAYVWFQAPYDMTIRLDASFWIAGDPAGVGRFAMNLDRALGNPGDGSGPNQAGNYGYVGANPNVDGTLMPSHKLIPNSATSASPLDIHSLTGWGTSYNVNPDAIQMYAGDRLGIWFYENSLGLSPLIGINFGVTQVPEPTSLLALLGGVGCLGGLLRRRR
ncbi:MAG: PEP-CTERM sorting domain-containing protein [Armatimonadetes bacterium]|nr:PEP-CTERM sorting domain-containing protein [Armatimonadota bacterium]